MEATKTQEPQLGNKVPNTFAELNEMTKGKYAVPQSNLESTNATISMANVDPNDPVLRFAKSMNLPKDTCTVGMPPQKSGEKYQIPESEYIWNAPYLKKTQIFPSYVSKNIIM